MAAAPSSRATLLIAAGSASIAFMVGFNFGAFGVVFFDQLLTIWVLATVVFVASLVSDTPPRAWPQRLVLLVPSLWLVAAWLDNTSAFELQDRAVFALTVMVTVLVLPAVAWIMITVINADFASLPGRSKGVVVATVGLFIIIGIVLGARNDTFLDCDDFKVSGSDLPANCLPATPEGS